MPSQIIKEEIDGGQKIAHKKLKPMSCMNKALSSSPNTA